MTILELYSPDHSDVYTQTVLFTSRGGVGILRGSFKLL